MPKRVQKWWRKVPQHKHEKIQFFNHPVNSKQVSDQLVGLQPSDFVAVKLDIDHTETEMEIIKVLEENAHLIDELFFEYHYYFDGKHFGWGINQHKKPYHNATSAISLMTRLRKKGIRSHFWI